MNNKQIPQIIKNAKIDRLMNLYIELTEDLKIISEDKQYQMDINPQQYIFLSGKQSGYYDALMKIEDHLRQLGAINK